MKRIWELGATTSNEAAVRSADLDDIVIVKKPLCLCYEQRMDIYIYVIYLAIKEEKALGMRWIGNESLRNRGRKKVKGRGLTKRKEERMKRRRKSELYSYTGNEMRGKGSSVHEPARLCLSAPHMPQVATAFVERITLKMQHPANKGWVQYLDLGASFLKARNIGAFCWSSVQELFIYTL